VVNVKGAWFYGFFSGSKYYFVALCQDPILNEGITGPQYKRMNGLDLEDFQNILVQSSILNIFCWNKC